MKVYYPGTFPYHEVGKLKTEKRKRGNPARGDKRSYVHSIAAFDIETTRDIKTEQSYMWVWQFAIEGVGVCLGRTWDDFVKFLQKISEELRGRWLKTFVHNLSYEFQYLRGVYDFAPDEVLIVRDRKILKAEMMGAVEMCCSYLQSNMSLAELTKHVTHSKTELDYSKTRYPWTPIAPHERTYIVHDVVGLIEAMRERLDDGFDVYTLPATSTGYVRRVVKNAMRGYNRDRLREMLPDAEVYTLLREEFRGGDTHANRYYTGDILHGVASYDRSSSYPDCQVNDIYPMGRWYHEQGVTMDSFLDRYYKRRACLMRVRMQGARLRDLAWPDPYIPRAKCRLCHEPVMDNGRVISADWIEMTINDVDFEIIIDEYDFDDFQILDFYHCSYGKLPRQITDVTLDLYRKKTSLKGVAGEEKTYNRAKAMLNSVYGMSVQQLDKPEISYVDGDYVTTSEPLEDMISKANQRAFQSYAWGCWITAWARYRLYEGICIAGAENFVYCDTDSVKFVDNPAIREKFARYNRARVTASAESGAYATDPAGVTHYMGVYEYEGTYEEFRTWGAKKYCVREDGKLELTCAGVGKKAGSEELEKAGGIEAFKPGFVFRAGGGVEAVYNDTPDVDHIIRDGRKIDITTNVTLRPSTYTLDLADDYYWLIKHVEKMRL